MHQMPIHQLTVSHCGPVEIILIVTPSLLGLFFYKNVFFLQIRSYTGGTRRNISSRDALPPPPPVPMVGHTTLSNI